MRSIYFLLCFAILSIISIPSEYFTQPPTDDSLKVTVVDIGVGLCCVVDMPNDKYMIYDTGLYGFSHLEQFIPKNKETELLILSHTDADHVGNVEKILPLTTVKRFVRTGFHIELISNTEKKRDAYVRALNKLASNEITPRSLYKMKVPQSKRLSSYENWESSTSLNDILSQEDFHLIERLHQSWNDSIWVNQRKDSFYYDMNNNLISILAQTWNFSTWNYRMMYSYSYDGNNNLLEELRQFWSNSIWVNEIKSVYSYDTNDNLTELIKQNWENNLWVNDERYTCTYDGNSNLIEQIEYVWGGYWNMLYRIIFTYDGNNDLIEELLQAWNGNSWIDLKKSIYSYNINNRLIEQLDQTWNGSNWINDYLKTYSYDVFGNLIEYLRQDWFGYWSNIYRVTYIYDINNNFIQELWQSWSGSGWLDRNQRFLSYDEHGNLIREEWQYYYGTWINDYLDIYSYIQFSDIKHLSPEIFKFSLHPNYPNPFNPTTTIEFDLPKSSDVTLKVFNILGEEVATLVSDRLSTGSYSYEWDASNLASGVYLYRLQAGNYVETRKMILMR